MPEISEDMQFGLFGGPLVPPGSGLSEVTAYDDYVEYVIGAEKAGFSGVFLTEHHFTGFGQASSPLTLLAYLAARTSSIRLGTGVTVLPWYNPVNVAEVAATVDVLSGGRLDIGVGQGFRASEFRGFGIDMDEAPERYQEALEVLLKAWRTDGRWSHSGPRWKYEDALSEPAPVQRPHPPIWMASGSPEGIARAADGGFKLLLDLIGSFEKTGQRITCYRDRLDELGKDFRATDIGVTRPLLLVDDPSDRADAIAERVQATALVAALATGGGEARNRMAAAYSSDIGSAIEAGAIVGELDECVERLERLYSEGVRYVLLDDHRRSLDTLRTFGREVIPRFRAQAARV